MFWLSVVWDWLDFVTFKSLYVFIFSFDTARLMHAIVNRILLVIIKQFVYDHEPLLCFHFSLTAWGLVAHICLWTGSSLVPVMACCLFGTKPLPEPMLVYCPLDPKEQTLPDFEWKYGLYEEYAIDNICKIAAIFLVLTINIDDIEMKMQRVLIKYIMKICFVLYHACPALNDFKSWQNWCFNPV